MNYVYLYLISPLHTGGTTQEGNLAGIARESHTNLPYIPSSTIRGKLRSCMKDEQIKSQLFGTDLQGNNKLEQGDIWIGDGSILWVPVPSLSHGVIWISCPSLLRRWGKFNGKSKAIPEENSCNMKGGGSHVYLKDAIFKNNDLKDWQEWQQFVPQGVARDSIRQVMVVGDRHYGTLVQLSLWRQVKIKLDKDKTVEGGFRYEEAIPPDTLMYFTWGVTSAANGSGDNSRQTFKTLLEGNDVLQIGGQESLGRGFVQQWFN